MKRIIGTTLMVLAISIGLISCSVTQRQYAIDTAALAVDIEVVKKFYAGVEKSMRIKQDDQKVFSDEEWVKFVEFDATVDSLMLKSEYIIKFDVKNIELYDAEFMWAMAKEGYAQCEALVKMKIDKFSDSEKLQLEILDRQFRDIDKEVTALFQDPTKENITKTVLSVVNVLSITIKVIGLMAL